MNLLLILRRVFFADMKKIVRLAKTKVLQPEDLPLLPTRLNPRTLPFAESELNTSNGRALLISMFKAGKKFLIPALGLNLLSVTLSLSKPILVNQFIHRINLGVHTKSDLTLALSLAILLGLVSVLASLAIQHYFLRILNSFQIYTNAINRMVFRHSLKLTQKARGETQLGDVVNHMSSDSDSVSDFGKVLGDFQESVTCILGVTALLFYFLGFTALVSFALILLMIPLTRKIAKSFSILDDELMKHRDQRVTLMSQVLNGIRVVKYFAWEKSVRREVEEVRSKELDARKRLARAEAMATLSYTAVSTLVLFCTLGAHVYRGFSLSPELVFTCVALFAVLEDPLAHLSEIVSRFAGAFIGADRICKFLQRESLAPSLTIESSDAALPGIEVENISLRYPGQEANTLSQISLQVLPGESIAVVGPVGSGKSSFLQALLREVPLREGNISFLDNRKKSVVPKLAYVPQEAFIMSGSLKENILFGEQENTERLKKALFASCLDADIDQLPAGLFTEIGERGVNLSGGQKQRVSLARAIAHQPNLVFLDDPLSAVDARTETQLVQRLIFGEWKTITRVVVTHRLAHLVQFDRIAFIEKGELAFFGTFEEALKNKNFASFYAESAKTEDGQALLAATKDSPPVSVPATSEKAAKTRVTEDEDRAVGAVQGGIYIEYMRALGGLTFRKRLFFLPLLFIGTASSTFLPLLQKAWLALSSNVQSGKPSSIFPIFYDWAAGHASSVLVYGALGFLTIIGVLLNKLLWLDRGMTAGRDMHNNMLQSVLSAPIRFFDSTPIGRILQRFSRDVEAIDIQLQWSFETTARSLFNIGTSLFLILTVLPAMIIAMVPIMGLYYLLQRDYRNPARETKRLDSISRSPRYAHFKETLQGLVVIRSLGKTNLFMNGFFDRLEQSQRMFYSAYMLNRWFSSRIPVLGGLISSSTAIGIVLYAYRGGISPGTAGLVMIYAISLWESLNWAVRIFSEMEAKMTSVERIRFYSSIESEKSVFRKPEAHTEHWPEKGEIIFDRVVARYAAHLPPVLKGISLRIPAGSRVGIIGRTGSGKSTMLQALFRCMELESGEIRIDGVNIASVPLEKLRRSLAIIPQDPTLFMGTLRNNLDRFSEYSDKEIWIALEKAKLKEYVQGLPKGLLSEVQESGSNLSQGQRQLLCLSRALLSQAKVIVMDEATASVDVRTDNLVQEVVRESCKGITIVIIAHRLGTVADSDLIFEVREGKLHRTLDLKKEELEAPVC